MKPNHSPNLRYSIPAFIAVAAIFALFSLAFVTKMPAKNDAESDHGHVHPLRKIQHKDAYRPTPIPDRIMLTWVGDPATSQAVTWRTSTNVKQAFAEIAPSDGGPKFVEKAKRLTAKTSFIETDLFPTHFHTVQFEDLKPESKYTYRVGDGLNWSEWIQFRTASTETKPFSFVYFGDAQNDVRSHWSRVVREAYRDAPKAAFMLHAGDLINVANADGEWGEWFYAGGFINRMTSSIAIPGNHEYAKPPKDRPNDPRTLSNLWRPTFAFPEHGPESLQETVYYIDYQGARIVCLNSNEQLEEQVPWIEKTLKENPHKWTVVTFHHPIYSSKDNRDNPTLRGLWQPLFDKYKVDIVLQGHDHAYARSKLMKSGDHHGHAHEDEAENKDEKKPADNKETATEENVPTGVTKQSDEGGTMYVVSVSGPKMYEVGRRPFMRRAAGGTQLYQIISIDGDEMRYEARTATGSLYDAFTLKKQDGKPNKLIDRIPDIKERRLPPKTK